MNRFFKFLFSKPLLISSSDVDAPILSAKDVDDLGLELADIFHGNSLKMPVNPKASSSIKQGEQASRYLGSGIEYEESRCYQPGDEVRRINWRLMARTGKAYTKLFQEERQESWTILLDQRQAMRFGTKKQLKVQQAIKAMGFFSWQAEKAGLSVELVCMDTQVRTSPTYEGKGVFEHLMVCANIPCPPLRLDQESSINDELVECQRRLQAGSRLIIISDLHDMNNETLSLLAALQQKVMVKMVVVFDEVEKKLPVMSGLKLQALNGQNINNLSNSQLNDYEHWAKEHFTGLMDKLLSIGVVAVELSTVDGLNKLREFN